MTKTNKIRLKDLTKGDVVKITYLDSDELLTSIAQVRNIGTNDAEFKDIVAISYDSEDEDWSAQDKEVEIHEILFNHNPKSIKKVLFEKFPEYGL